MPHPRIWALLIDQVGAGSKSELLLWQASAKLIGTLPSAGGVREVRGTFIRSVISLATQRLRRYLEAPECIYGITTALPSQ